MKNFATAITLCLFLNVVTAQGSADNVATCDLRISLLTCTPGMELYSTFGHSAVRVTDSAKGRDMIFNYGTFDFDDPSFYSKFTRGKLLYFVSIESFEDFKEQYQYEQRGITEQVLKLSCEEKESLLAALLRNAKEENKYYKYDFVYDNCTTRLRDMIMAKNNGRMTTAEIRPRNDISFRNLIHEYLDKGRQPWSKIGIDILLGAPLDKKISNSEAMFLPDYLLKAFDSTTVDGHALVESKAVILQSSAAAPAKSFFTPLVCFGILFLLIAALSFVPGAKGFLYYFDVVFFFIAGLLGCLLVFMWLGTDHQTARNNFNLVWAFPLHVIIAFFMQSKRKWPQRYFLFTCVLLALLLVTWKWLPQEMNNGLLPIVALLLLRSFIRYKQPAHGN